jgi:hypothetical protein
MKVDRSAGDSREQRLEHALAAFYEKAEGGTAQDRQALLDRHPELAAELAEFFAVQDQLHGLAAPFRSQPANELIDVGDGLIGDCEFLGEIARGGMGIVYRARQRSLNRLVALKVIRDGARATPDDARRFRNEAEAAANLDHPNIVPIYEVGEDCGCSYFSMKLVEG